MSAHPLEDTHEFDPVARVWRRLWHAWVQRGADSCCALASSGDRTRVVLHVWQNWGALGMPNPAPRGYEFTSFECDGSEVRA